MFLLECLLSLLMGLTYVADLTVKGALHIAGDEIYGHVVVLDALGATSWLFAVGLLFRERSRVILRRPHGFSLVLFWLASLLWLCLEVSWCPASPSGLPSGSRHALAGAVVALIKLYSLSQSQIIFLAF